MTACAHCVWILFSCLQCRPILPDVDFVQTSMSFTTFGMTSKAVPWSAALWPNPDHCLSLKTPPSPMRGTAQLPSQSFHGRPCSVLHPPPSFTTQQAFFILSTSWTIWGLFCVVGSVLCIVGSVLCIVGSLAAFLISTHQNYPIQQTPDFSQHCQMSWD